MSNQKFVIGKGTVIEVAMLPSGIETEPTAVATLTVTEPIAKGATSITPFTALGAGVNIPANSYLTWTAPTTGKEVLVQLTSTADTGDTSMAVSATPADIADNSTTSYPLRLKSRTAANLGRSATEVNSVDFDDDAWERGLTTSLSADLEVPGNWSQLDAAYNTLEYAFNNLRQIYFWLKTPAPNSDYSAGKIYKGVASITAMPLDIPANGIITGNISLKVNGPLVMVNPTATA